MGVAIVQVKIAGYGIDDFARDRSSLIDERAHQTVFAEQVDDSRNAHRVTENGDGRFGIKNRLAIRSGDAKALVDIRLGFFKIKRMRLGAQGQALTKLAQSGLLQALFEFGLAYKNDLQKLLGKGFEIGEHANLFEHFIREALGLVDNEHRGFAGAVAIE